MQSRLLSKTLLITLVLALCGLSLFPDPFQQMRLGPDLKGGVSLLYEVTVSSASSADAEIAQTISVLRKRLDPNGVRGLVFTQEAGNRIQVLMPHANEKIRQQRQAYQDQLDHFASVSLSTEQVVTVLGRSEEAWAVELARLSDGYQQRGEKLTEARKAYQAIQTLKAANAAAVKANDQAKIHATAGQVVRQQLALDDQVQAITEMVLSPAYLATVLKMSVVDEFDKKTRERTPNTSPRFKMLQKIVEQMPNEKARLDQLVALHDAYFSEKRPIEDAEDVKRQIRGQGALTFQITVTADEAETLGVEKLRKKLIEKGPYSQARNAQAKWYMIDDPEALVEDSVSVLRKEAEYRHTSGSDIWAQETERMYENTASFFLGRGLIGERYGEDYYVLLWDIPSRALTDRHQEGWKVVAAGTSQDGNGFPAVSFNLNERGAIEMGNLTSNNKNRRMGILLDGRFYSAPSINTTIYGSGIITGGRGGFSQTELDYLVTTLAAGSLGGKLSYDPIEERSINASLGEDNLKKGLYASYGAMIAVGLFMMFYYFFAGIITNVALAANVVVILGVMVMQQATFTLPGIAGIVLTIGMCVDANVLIFERIREELNSGADMLAALRLGYQKAFSSIIDGNMTNLIVCFILGYTASAEVQGFAVTLGIGICATLFTSLFMTRVLFTYYFRLFPKARLTMMPMVIRPIEQLLHPSFDWLSKRFLFFGISLIGIVISLSLVFSQGSSMFAIEFRSGTEVAFNLKEGQVLSLQQARDRIGKVAGWFGPNGAASLSAEDQKVYQRLTSATAIYRQQLVTQAAERYKTKRTDPITPQQQTAFETDAAAATDLSQLTEASVVAIGDLDDQFRANGFSIVATVNHARTMADAVLAAFEDQLNIQRPHTFSGADQTQADRAYAMRIDNEVLGTVIGRPGYTQDVSRYVGGVAIVLDNIDPPIAPKELTDRIKAMRLQPPYNETQQFRPFEVITLERDGNDSALATSAVLVSREPYVEVGQAELDPQAWLRGVASDEWSLVREALIKPSNLDKVSNFTPTVAETIRNNAIIALILSMLAIIAYIWFRFGSLRYGLAAIAALTHDVIITLGFVVLSGVIYRSAGGVADALLLTPFKIGMPMIAALLTIIGYSLNDTIVLFDRIRERRGLHHHATRSMVNLSINQVVSRTVLTSLTTFLAVFVMYVFGGAGIHDFAFALVIGVLVGTYSSIAVASPLLLIGRGKQSNSTEVVTTSA